MFSLYIDIHYIVLLYRNTLIIQCIIVLLHMDVHYKVYLDNIKQQSQCMYNRMQCLYNIIQCLYNIIQCHIYVNVNKNNMDNEKIEANFLCCTKQTALVKYNKECFSTIEYRIVLYNVV